MKNKLLLLLLIGFTFSVKAQLTPIIDSIPMSDGKKLAADVYIPSGITTGPVILIQTPYNRILYRYAGLPLQIKYNVNASNYIFVILDWRGFYGSAAAKYAGSPTGGQDGASAVEWIAQQSWSNGKVGTWGPSALGKIQFQTAKENPTHLVCICPLVAGPQYEYNEYFPNGVLRTEYVQQLDGLGFGMSPILLANPVHNATWAYAENVNYYPSNINVPCLMIGGWYDHTIEQMLPFFNGIRTQSPVGVRDKHRLLMGPWVHGGHGTAQVGTTTQGELSYPNAKNWNDSLALLFFDYHLRTISNGWNTTPYVQYYQLGENSWKNSTAWPPAGTTNVNFYFHQNKILDNTLPSNTTDQLMFNYDPTNPSPTYGGPTLRQDLKQGPYDQRDTVESRNDILILTSNALTQNVVLKGSAVVHMKIASDRVDTDFDIRLTDVYPDGRSMLINDGTMRMRFRNGENAADTALMTANQIYDCTITMPNTANTFLAGHKIRVDVTSSNYPRFNRNMNTGGPMYPGNNMDVLVSSVTAANTVYANTTNTSYITLPLLGYITGVDEVKNNEGIKIYPNPVSDQLQIETNGNAVYTVSVYNSLGEKIIVKTISANDAINVENFLAGIYFIELRSDNRVQYRKFVKQ